MIEKAIYNILSSDSDLGDLGANIRFGIDPQIPDGTASPAVSNYIVFYRNTTIPYDTKSGRSTLDEAQIQINMFSKTALGAANLAECIRGVLDRVASGTYATIVVQSISFQNQTSLFEFNESYNNKGLYQMTQFYQCRFEPQYQ